MNGKLSKHGFWHCHENRLIKMIQTIPHNQVSFKSTSLYYGLGYTRIILNPQYRKVNLTLTYRLWGIV